MKHKYASVLAFVTLTISIASVGFAQPLTQTPVPGGPSKIENQELKPDDGAAKKAEPKKESDPKTQTKSKAADPQSDLHWVFLKAGKSTEGLSAEKIDAMLAKQLANYKRLSAENQLLTAGPMTDPEKKLTGMVVVRAKNKSEIAEMFAPDPYVQSGYIKLETVPMEISHGKINTKVTPQGTEEFFMVVLEQTEEKNPTSDIESTGTDQSLQKMPFQKMSSEDGLLLAVKFLDSKKKRRGVLVFKKPKEERAIQKAIQKVMDRLKEIPPVKNGKWRSRSFPLFMGKGSLRGNG